MQALYRRVDLTNDLFWPFPSGPHMKIHSSQSPKIGFDAAQAVRIVEAGQKQLLVIEFFSQGLTLRKFDDEWQLINDGYERSREPN